MSQSNLEDLFYSQCKAAGLPLPARQLRLIPIQRQKPDHPRELMTRHKVDFAWIDEAIVLEVQGGTWGGGRHTRGKGYAGDCWKMAALQLCGWIVYYATGDQVKSGEALAWITEALENAQSKAASRRNQRSKEGATLAG